jgi:hypothetical protein
MLQGAGGEADDSAGVHLDQHIRIGKCEAKEACDVRCHDASARIAVGAGIAAGWSGGTLRTRRNNMSAEGSHSKRKGNPTTIEITLSQMSAAWAAWSSLQVVWERYPLAFKWILSQPASLSSVRHLW